MGPEAAALPNWKEGAAPAPKLNPVASGAGAAAAAKLKPWEAGAGAGGPFRFPGAVDEPVMPPKLKPAHQRRLSEAQTLNEWNLCL